MGQSFILTLVNKFLFYRAADIENNTRRCGKSLHSKLTHVGCCVKPHNGTWTWTWTCNNNGSTRRDVWVDPLVGVSLIPRITAVTQPEASSSVSLGVCRGVGCKEGSGPDGDLVTFQWSQQLIHLFHKSLFYSLPFFLINVWTVFGKVNLSSEMINAGPLASLWHKNVWAALP